MKIVFHPNFRKIDHPKNKNSLRRILNGTIPNYLHAKHVKEHFFVCFDKNRREGICKKAEMQFYSGAIFFLTAFQNIQ